MFAAAATLIIAGFGYLVWLASHNARVRERNWQHTRAEWNRSIVREADQRFRAGLDDVARRMNDARRRGDEAEAERIRDEYAMATEPRRI